jgi:hypothetical protein
MKYVNTLSGDGKLAVRNELEYSRMLLSVILYACLALNGLRVQILDHKPAAMTTIFFS